MQAKHCLPGPLQEKRKFHFSSHLAQVRQMINILLIRFFLIAIAVCHPCWSIVLGVVNSRSMWRGRMCDWKRGWLDLIYIAYCYIVLSKSCVWDSYIRITSNSIRIVDIHSKIFTFRLVVMISRIRLYYRIIFCDSG